jgi:hypothetical protein
MIDRMIERREDDLRAHDVRHHNCHDESLPRRSSRLDTITHDEIDLKILGRLNVAERLFQIGDQIAHILDAH